MSSDTSTKNTQFITFIHVETKTQTVPSAGGRSKVKHVTENSIFSSEENDLNTKTNNKMSKTNIRYTCNGHIAKAPEGGKITCRAAKSWIVPVDTSCSIECTTGNPTDSKITCKDKGWRPTNEVTCSGVSPGVIVGVLIGGLAAVVIIGIIYAKYKQHQKKKNKATEEQQATNRPGRKVLVGPEVASRPSSASGGYDGPEGGEKKQRPPGRGVSSDADGRGNWKNANNGSKPPPYNPSQDPRMKRPSRDSHQAPPAPPHGGRRGRSSDNPPPQYTGYPSNGYHSDQIPAYPSYQGGSHGDAAVGYGYQATQPQVGYGSYPQAPGYPANRANYGRPYNVST